MHESVLAFAARALTTELVAGKRVLEVGSGDVNGSVRPIVQALGPAEYLGVDMAEGPGVDMVVDATALLSTFGAESVDVVICCEMLEHVEDWRAAVRNLAGVLKPGGVLLVTTRSRGFMYHAFPIDTYRYELADMRQIFADFEILILETDPQAPGVLFLGRKHEVNGWVRLDGIDLYRMTPP